MVQKLSFFCELLYAITDVFYPCVSYKWDMVEL